MAYMPKVISAAIASDADSDLLPNRSSGIMAPGVRASTRRNSSMEPTNTPIANMLPRRSPAPVRRFDDGKRERAEREDRERLTGQIETPALGRGGFATKRYASASASRPGGTTSRKMLRQPAWSTSTPPSVGPMMKARPLQLAQMPSGRARSRGSG